MTDDNIELESNEIVDNSKIKEVAKAGKRSAKSIQEKQEKIVKETRKSDKKSIELSDKKIIKKKPTRSLLERKGKKYRQSAKLIDRTKMYDLTQAIELVKKTSSTKFDASVEAHIKLNVDPKHADQNIRDTLILPAGNGKNIIVAVLTEDETDAKKSGADLYSNEKIINNLEKGVTDFDILITTPSYMSKLSKYARILGPRGLMPNPKSGTVTTNIQQAITEAKTGKVEYRVDSYGIIHLLVGKCSFADKDLFDNINTVFNSIKNNKPQSVKSNYIQTIYLTSSMGPSVKIDSSSLA